VVLVDEELELFFPGYVEHEVPLLKGVKDEVVFERILGVARELEDRHGRPVLPHQVRLPGLKELDRMMIAEPDRDGPVGW
jgi:hypothetical protein